MTELCKQDKKIENLPTTLYTLYISLGSISNKHPYEGDELDQNFMNHYKCNVELTTITDFGGILIKEDVRAKRCIL